MAATLKRGLVRTRIETEQGGTQLLKGMGSTRARHEHEWDSLGEKGPDLGLDALEHRFYPILRRHAGRMVPARSQKITKSALTF